MNSQPVDPAGVLNQPIAPPQKSDSKRTMAIIGFILGIVSLFSWLLPICGFPIAIAAVILSALGINSSKGGLAIAGVIMGGIAILLALLNSVLGMFLGLTGYFGDFGF
jgi:hypothetical protein